jgi:hypothetical protein
MTAECGRAADLDQVQNFKLLGRYGELLAVLTAVAAKDIGHLDVGV